MCCEGRQIISFWGEGNGQPQLWFDRDQVWNCVDSFNSIQLIQRSAEKLYDCCFPLKNSVYICNTG